MPRLIGKADDEIDIAAIKGRETWLNVQRRHHQWKMAEDGLDLWEPSLKEIDTHKVRSGDPDRGRSPACRMRGEPVAELRHLADNRLRDAQHLVAGIGQTKRSARPVDKRCARPLLQ